MDTTILLVYLANAGLALLDLWNTDAGVKRILPDYVKEDEKLPVYKMPHLEGWAVAGDYLFAPAIGKHEVLVIDKQHMGTGRSHTGRRTTGFCDGQTGCAASLGQLCLSR